LAYGIVRGALTKVQNSISGELRKNGIDIRPDNCNFQDKIQLPLARPRGGVISTHGDFTE
jgi:hypothetical protein